MAVTAVKSVWLVFSLKSDCCLRIFTLLFLMSEVLVLYNASFDSGTVGVAVVVVCAHVSANVLSPAVYDS